MLSLLKHLKIKQWILIAISILFIVGQVYLDLLLPEYMKTISTLIMQPGGKIAQVWQNGAKMLLCALASGVLAVIVGLFSALIATSFAKNIREKVFFKVESFSLEEMQKFSTASLITRSTNDVMQVQFIIAMGMQVLIKAPILATWATIKILNKSWQWSLATAIALVVLLVLIIVLILVVLPKFKKIQTLTDNLNSVTQENLTGIRVVRAYNAEEFEQEKFEKANEELTKTHLFTSKVMAIMSPGISLITGGLNLSIYWIGAYLINNAQFINRINVFSDMVIFSSYAMQIVFSFIMLTMIFIMVPRAQVSAKRINEVLNTNAKITDGNLTINDVEQEKLGEVEFKNVSFKYPDADEYVLKDINFVAKRGQTVAFIGSTGSGKSTLINLIPRFYDATEGEILVNGINVKDYKQTDLRAKIGYISQKAVLFSGTVKENLTFGDNKNCKPDDEVLNQAISVSQSNFVNKLENKLDSQVNEGGTNFSGGQKQRLSIARAIARQPEIYIIDDSFSALDYKTDKNLRSALKKHNKNITTLIVAQRIGTIKDADTIIVLDNGKIVGMGKHNDLLKNCTVYQEIASSQLSKEELENE